MKLAFSIEMSNVDDYPPAEASKSVIDFSMTYKFNSVIREIYLDDIEIRMNDKSLIHFKYSKESERHTVEKIGDTLIPPSLKATISREFRVRHFVPQPFTSRLGMMGDRERGGPYQDFLRSLAETDDGLVARKLLRISRHLLKYVESSDYIGPLRTPPQRTYLFSGERRQRIGASGENLTTLLVKGASQKTRLPQQDTVLNRVNTWLSRTKLANAIVLEPISDRHYELRVQNFFTKEKQNIADVGYGHSQVLPVLVGGYAMTPGTTFIMEQPELHLHPKAQAELGDFLFDLYENRVQTIVETHSEHLILRLQQHVAAGHIDPHDIRIFYIHNDPTLEPECSDSGSSEVLFIDIDRKGCFSRDWPNGFFPERLEEARKLAQIRAKQQQLF